MLHAVILRLTTSESVQYSKKYSKKTRGEHLIRRHSLIFVMMADCHEWDHGPVQVDGTMITGKVGVDLDEAEANAAARVTGLAILATLRAHLGSLDRVTRFVKVLGMVNCTPDFGTQPAVINGFSDLVVEVFGENGRAARSAVGMGALPGNIPVEIEAIVQVSD